MLATRGTEGRYYPYTYAVTLKDMIKFHGHLWGFLQEFDFDVVAINTDPSAPIFEVAHVGIVGNVLQILPLVVKDLKG